MYILNKLKNFSSILILITLITFVLLSNWQFNKYKYKMSANIFSYNLKYQAYDLKLDKRNKVRININCKYQNHLLLENKILKKKTDTNYILLVLARKTGA